MHRIAFAIEKGGTGKTTSAVHLAHGLARLGYNVLLVDTDTQDQCAAHLGHPQFQPGLAELILGEITPRQGLVQARPGLFLLPAGEKLAAVKGRLDDIARNASIKTESVLAAALSFTKKGNLDYVILDTAPGTDAFLVNVLLYAGLVVIPVPPEMLAIRGMTRFLATLGRLGKRPFRILPTLHDKRVGKTERILDKLKEHFGDKLLHKISYTSHLSEAAGAGLTLFEYNSRHPAAAEYEELARTLVKEAMAHGG